ASWNRFGSHLPFLQLQRHELRWASFHRRQIIEVDYQSGLERRRPKGSADLIYARDSDIFRQQIVESPRIIIWQFIGEVAHDPFPIQKDARGRAPHAVSPRDPGVGVSRDGIFDAELFDADLGAGGAVFDVDSEHAHALALVLGRQSVDAWRFFLTRGTP